MHDKGYERMTAQDVLTTLQMSKGALYHYFDSKAALLEGIVEAMERVCRRRCDPPSTIPP